MPSPPPSLLQRIKAAFPPFSNPPIVSPSPPWLAFTRTSPTSPISPTPQRPNSPTPLAFTHTSPTSPVLPTSQHPNTPTPQRPNAPTPHSWHCTLTLTQHTNSVTAIAISPDSTLLASGDRQGHIYLWNLESGTLLHQFSAHTFWQQAGHRDRITDLQVTADGISLVSSSADGTLKQWDIGQRQLVKTLEGEGWVISALAIHPDGHLLISGGANGAIDLWDLTRHQFIQRLWIHTDRINDLVLATDGVTLFSGSEDGLVYGWDLRTATAIASIRAHHNGVSALVLDGEGQIGVSGGGDRTLRLWQTPSAMSQSLPQDDALSFHLLHTLSVDLDRVTAITMHPSGTLWANSQDDIHIQLWSLKNDLKNDLTTARSVVAPARGQMHTQRGMVLNQDWSITALRFSPKGDRLVSCSADGTIKIWQAQDGLQG